MIAQFDTIKNKFNFGLYIVSTPIGNLSDIKLRAIDVLKKSEYILCEDTRTSKKLLDKYKIKSKLISNHKFNEKKNINKIIEILKSEKIVSVISDAGTPSISDPGKIIINECVKKKINIYPIPGASAVSSAVSISGFSEKYFFYGFWKVRVVTKNFIAFKFRYQIPFIFVLVILFLSIGGFFNQYLWSYLIFLIIFYFSFSVVNGISICFKTNIKYIPIMPIIFIILHLSFGLGFLIGLGNNLLFIKK